MQQNQTKQGARVKTNRNVFRAYFLHGGVDPEPFRSGFFFFFIFFSLPVSSHTVRAGHPV
jgi:hypothetical protein